MPLLIVWKRSSCFESLLENKLILKQLYKYYILYFSGLAEGPFYFFNTCPEPQFQRLCFQKKTRFPPRLLPRQCCGLHGRVESVAGILTG